METSKIKKERIVVGIDIGTTKIVCLIGKKNEKGEIDIIGKGKTESIGVKRADIINVLETSKSVKLAVEQAEAQSGYKVSEVFVGIAGSNIRSEMNRAFLEINEEGHIISKEDIDKLTKEQFNLKLEPGQKIIDIVPQSYKVDGMVGEITPDLIVGVPGKRLECTYRYISANVDNINNIRRSVKDAGYEIKNLLLQPICSAEAVTDVEERDAGVCLVDIGGGTTDVAIYHQGIMRYTSVIQLAGDVISKDIETACNIVPKQAKALKEQFGDCIFDKNQENEIICIPGIRGMAQKEISKATLTNVIKARLEDILGQVLYDIKQSGYDRNLVAGIVLTGGGAMIKNITNLTSYITEGISTRIGKSNDYLVKTNEVAKELEHPMYATVVGLLIKGFEYYEENEPIIEEPESMEEAPAPEIPVVEESENKKGKSSKKKGEKEKNNDGEKNNAGVIEKVQGFFKRILNDGME